MKCPTCVEESEKSKVYCGGSTTTLMGYSSYYDEEGEYHCHDPNKISTSYSCSRGHKWGVSKVPSCPAPGCDYGAPSKASFKPDSRPSEGIM